MADIEIGTTQSSTPAAKKQAKIWINMGKEQKSEGGKDYLLAPYFGVPVDTVDTKRMTKSELALHKAVLERAKELGVGTHDLKFTVQMTVLPETPVEVKAGDFDL